MLKVVVDGPTVGMSRSMLDEVVVEGARRMLGAALEAEAAAYVAGLAGEVDEHGHRMVARNGHAEAREIKTSAGAIGIRSPRVNDRRVDPDTGERRQFKSVIVPPWCRSSPKVVEVLPLMYLHGMSSGDFGPALEQFFGTNVGLSPSVIARLTKQWQDDLKAFGARSLADRDFVYVWADGIHFNVRLDESRLCALVLVGVRPHGTKELIAIGDGMRESKDSWADLLRDLRRRGMGAPVLAVGDGVLGFWAAVRDVWPETRHGRCWFDKAGNVLAALPKAQHPSAKKLLADIRDAEHRDAAVKAIGVFVAEFGVKWPKAAAKIVDDTEELLAFFDFPAEHWIHLKTTNPIESTFATVRLRTKVTKGPGSKAAGLAMAYKLLEAAQARWRKVNAPELVALVRAGAVFHKGKLVDNNTTKQEAAA